MFLDTSGMFTLLHAPEKFHAQAHQFYQTASDRCTHSYALAELIALAQARRVPRSIALVFCDSIVNNPDIDVVWVDEALHRSAMQLLHSRLDKSYSLCDAVSFLLMRERSILDALTTDRHFEQEGFRRLLG
jgi:uncharacterized protein